jgi:hypothetical protein
MTTRERINKTRGRAALIGGTGFLIAVGGVIAKETYPEFSMAVGFVGFALFGWSNYLRNIHRAMCPLSAADRDVCRW